MFFGNYALDDSFVGYSNAQNLARGLGFAFNPGERLLTTSAPLVVPFYAAGAVLGIDIVTFSQIVSALALVASALLAYCIALRIAPAFGASSAAFVLVTSPFVVLLWSHESLVWLALALGAVELTLQKRFAGGALVLGLSGLARPEAVFVAPFLLGWVQRTSGRDATVRYVVFAAIPFLLWAAYALPVFGTVFSQSIAAKHAQMLYGGVPYASGLIAHYIYLYANTTSNVAAAFLLLALALTLAATLRTAATREATSSLVIWFALLSAFYIVAQVHFFVWFGIQAAVVTAFLAGAAWAAPASLLGRLGKFGALSILAVNALFIASLARDASSKYSLDGMLVLPHVEQNNYYRLALYTRAHSQPGDTIAYPEIGQLRYYGGRTIVDFDGLATPGVARAMQRGDTIWAFERYRPTIFIDAARHWANIVDPPEYDWFARAYARGETLVLPPELGKDHFTFYRLINAAQVPPPDVLEPQAGVEIGADGSSFRAVPAGATAALEVRLDARRCTNGRIVVSATRGPGATVPIVATPFRHTVRVRVPLAAAAEGPFEGRIEGCSAGALAPPLLPRFGFLVVDTKRVRGSPADAIRLFAPAPG